MKSRSTRGTKHGRRYPPGFGTAALQNRQISSSALCSMPRTRIIVPILPPGRTGGGELRNPPASSTTTAGGTNTLPRRTKFLQDGIVVQAQASLGPSKGPVKTFARPIAFGVTVSGFWVRRGFKSPLRSSASGRALGYPARDPRRSGRVAEGGALLRRYGGECLHRGFESLLLRFAARERCPSGLRSATGNRVRAERCVAGSNPALSASFLHAEWRPEARKRHLVVRRVLDLDAGGLRDPVAKLHPGPDVALGDVAALPEGDRESRPRPREKDEALEALALAEPAHHLLGDHGPGVRGQV